MLTDFFFSHGKYFPSRFSILISARILDSETNYRLWTYILCNQTKLEQGRRYFDKDRQNPLSELVIGVLRPARCGDRRVMWHVSSGAGITIAMLLTSLSLYLSLDLQPRYLMFNRNLNLMALCVCVCMRVCSTRLKFDGVVCLRVRMSVCKLRLKFDGVICL